MPNRIHEGIQDWIYSHLNFIQEVVQAENICEAIQPSLRLSGAPTFKLATGFALADEGISVMNLKTEHWLQGAVPFVIFEVSNSQRPTDVKRKAWHWLHKFNNHAQAVVIYDLSHPITETRNFKAEISVWVRSSDDIGMFVLYIIQKSAYRRQMCYIHWTTASMRRAGTSWRMICPQPKTCHLKYREVIYLLS